MPYIDRYYKNQYEEAIWKLKAQLALYESDDAIAAVKKNCDLRIRAAAEREKRAHDSWMNALAVNKELKQKNTQLRHERDQFKCDAGSALGVNKSLKRRLACAERLADTLEDQLEELKKAVEEKDKKIKALEDIVLSYDKKFKQYDEYFKNDNDRLQSIEESIRLDHKCFLALIKHAIDGNSTDQLKEARKQMEEYLINKS